jgi:hypothetical protein
LALTRGSTAAAAAARVGPAQVQVNRYCKVAQVSSQYKMQVVLLVLLVLMLLQLHCCLILATASALGCVRQAAA